MIRTIKAIILISPFVFFTFTPAKNSEAVENYYNLKKLKNSEAPREMKIIKMENMVQRKDLIESGVLVTYKNRYAKDVKISGDFSNWEAVDMTRGTYGVWYFFINNLINKKSVRYKFLVDGVWIADPMNNEKEDDNAGSYVSLIQPVHPAESNMLTYRFITPYLIEFMIYEPKAKHVSIVGDFNNWNPENDLLEKSENGVWILRKRLPPGIYRYKYIIDGVWTVDLYNERTASDDTGEICSLISIGR